MASTQLCGTGKLSHTNEDTNRPGCSAQALKTLNPKPSSSAHASSAGHCRQEGHCAGSAGAAAHLCLGGGRLDGSADEVERCIRQLHAHVHARRQLHIAWPRGISSGAGAASNLPTGRICIPDAMDVQQFADLCCVLQSPSAGDQQHQLQHPTEPVLQMMLWAPLHMGVSGQSQKRGSRCCP